MDFFGDGVLRVEFDGDLVCEVLFFEFFVGVEV